MSPKLPVVSGEEAVKAFRKIGYEIVRQRGTHLRLRDLDNTNHKPLTIPLHQELKPGLLRKLLRDANISVKDFMELV